MSFNRESEPERRIGRSQGGEPTGTPRSSAFPKERLQLSRMVTVDRLVRKDELSLYQASADGFTQAGLGTYSFAVAQRQIDPVTGASLSEDSLFVAFTYSGLEDRDVLYGVIREAKGVKQKLERERKPKSEIDKGVQEAIESAIDSEWKLEMFFQTMLFNAHNKKPAQ